MSAPTLPIRSGLHWQTPGGVWVRFGYPRARGVREGRKLEQLLDVATEEQALELERAGAPLSMTAAGYPVALFVDGAIVETMTRETT